MAFLTLESGSPKKWCAIAHEYHLNEAYARFGARLTLQMVKKTVMDNCMHRQGRGGQAVMSNCMHRKGLDGRPQEHFGIFTSEFGSPKKWCDIEHENRRNEGYARFGARLTF